MTKEEILAEVSPLMDEEEHAVSLFNRWLDRGDGIAVYENKSLDSSNGGHKICMSYGSRTAQIETESAPEQMPDTGQFSTPWAYRLVATYKVGE